MGEVKFKGGNNVPNASMKKKHYWWRYLLVWIGASVFTLGALAAGVYIAGGVVPVKNYINFFGDPNEYLTPEYQDKSLFNIVKIVSSGEIDTLEDVNRITPLVESYFEQINTDYVEPNLKFRFNWDEAKYIALVKKNSYGEKDYPIDTSTTLPQYLVDEMKKNTKLASLINIETSPYKTLLTYFLYDVKRDAEGNVMLDENGKPILGDPYSVYDFMNQESKNASNAYDEISEAYNPEDDFFKHVMDNVLDCGRVSDLDANFNPQDPLMKVIQNYTLRDIFDGKLNDISIGKLFNHEDDKGLLAKLFRMTLGELNTFDFDNARFYDLMDITYAYNSKGELIKGSIKDEDFVYDAKGNIIDKDTVSPLVLRSMGEFKMSTVQDENVLDNYYISQFVEVTDSSDVALKTLGGFTFKDIKKKDFLDDLQLQQIMNIPKEGEKGYSPLLDSIRENSLGSLKDDKTFKGIHLSKFFNINELDKDKDRVLIALLKIDTEENPVTLGNVGRRVNDIELGEFIDAGKNPSRLLQTVSHKKLPELSDLINNLSVKETMDVEVGSSYHDTALNKYYFCNHKGEWKEYKDDEKLEKTAQELFEIDYNDVKNKEGYYEGVDDEFVAARIKEDSKSIDDIKEEDYGKNAKKRNELYDVKDVKFSDPGDFITQIKQKMKLDALVDIDDNSPKVLVNLKDCTLNQVADRLKNFSLDEMLGVEKNPKSPDYSPLLFALKDAKLFVAKTDDDYIGNKIENLTISQIMNTEDGPVFLQTIGNYTIGGTVNPLSSLDISTLKFNEIVDYTHFTKDDDTGILKELWGDPETGGDFTISAIPGRLMQCSLLTILGKQIYKDEEAAHDDNSELKKQWWYLLTSQEDYSNHNYTNPFPGPGEKAYEEPFIIGHLDSGKSLKLNQINSLIANLQYHFANRTIGELAEAGFLTIDSATLSKTVAGHPLGSYTISGLLAVIG